MSIEVSHLTKTYGTQTAVNDISFSLRKGEITGFLGPNGAGKSTSMKMITGYVMPEKGGIKVCGIAVNGQGIETKKKIGYLPEANPLYPDMYVREYLHFMAGIHGLQNKKDKIEEVIQRVGLTVEAHKKTGQLSKGYKQRVGLAAAILHDPEVLILDEPTSGLDPNQIVEIREVIRQLGKEKTLLFSSHIMQEVEAVCDRVIIINKGVLVADSPMASLRANKNDRQVIVVQFKEDIDTDLLKALQEVTEVIRKNQGQFQITCGNEETVRTQLMQLSIDKKLNLISLQTESQQMEDVFRELTGKS